MAQRARGAYIATMCQLEAAYNLLIAAQSTKYHLDDIQALNAYNGKSKIPREVYDLYSSIRTPYNSLSL